MISHLRLKAYGKINLGLDVLGKREDGYHQVRMIMQTVGLHDSIDIYRKARQGIAVESNLYYLPNNEQNLAYRAAALLMEEFGVDAGLSIRLRKFIPVSAGMAGGSSDAAAVLFGVNKMFGLGLSKEQLMERGVKLGSGCPILPDAREPPFPRESGRSSRLCLRSRSARSSLPSRLSVYRPKPYTRAWMPWSSGKKTIRI